MPAVQLVSAVLLLMLAAHATGRQLTLALTIPNPQVTIVSGGQSTPYPAADIRVSVTYDTADVQFPRSGGELVSGQPLTIAIPGLPDAVIDQPDSSVTAGNVSRTPIGYIFFNWFTVPDHRFEGVVTSDTALHDFSLLSSTGTFVVPGQTYYEVAEAGGLISFSLPDGRIVYAKAFPAVTASLVLSFVGDATDPGAQAVPALGLASLLALMALLGCAAATVASKHR